MKYLLIKKNKELVIVTNLNDLYRDPSYDPVNDKLYMIGNEVKLELIAKTINHNRGY